MINCRKLAETIIAIEVQERNYLSLDLYAQLFLTSVRFLHIYSSYNVIDMKTFTDSKSHI